MENPSLDNTLAHEAGPGHDTYRVHIVNPNEVSVLILYRISVQRASFHSACASEFPLARKPCGWSSS